MASLFYERPTADVDSAQEFRSNSETSSINHDQEQIYEGESFEAALYLDAETIGLDAPPSTPFTPTHGYSEANGPIDGTFSSDHLSSPPGDTQQQAVNELSLMLFAASTQALSRAQYDSFRTGADPQQCAVERITMAFASVIQSQGLSHLSDVIYAGLAKRLPPYSGWLSEADMTAQGQSQSEPTGN